VLAFVALAAPLSAFAKPVTDKSPDSVVDVETGAVLADREADQPWYPASLTKLMTAYVTFKAMADGKITPATKVVETANAAAQEPVKMGFPVGTKMSLDNALKMMIVPSANDIAVAIAEAVGGNSNDFVGTMNGEATRLGMAHSHFENPNGLPGSNHVSTARDLAVLARQIWSEFPEQRSLFGIQAIQSGDSVFHSPNLMLLERYRGAQGMKTGFTCEAGYNLAATATRNGRTLLVIVLGRTSSSDRAELAARLLDGAFAAKPSDTAPTVLASFTDTASDPGPIDMRICSGSGVDRVGFSDSVLGPVVAVTDPVKVITDNPPAPPAAVAKSTSSKSSGSQSASTAGDRSSSKSSSSASASKSGTTASKGSSGSKGAVSASTKSGEAFAAAAAAAASAPLEDQSARDRVFKVFANDD